MSEYDIVVNLENWEYIDLLKNKSVELDIDRLTNLSKYENDDLRIEISEFLYAYQTYETDEILYSTLSDSCEIVRINACDLLYNSLNSRTLDCLISKLDEESEMVRGFAVLSIADNI